MMYGAKYGRIRFPGGLMEYVRFGTGQRHLILLPGLGESLRSLKGMALPMAVLYRAFAADFTVWVFSRRTPVPDGASTRDMAQDLRKAMAALKIPRAAVVGVSMGGMIAQFLAADFPEAVEKLVLTVTCPCPNPILEEAVGQWEDCARRGDHTAFMESNVRLIYTGEYYRRNKWLIPLMGKLTKPASYDSFFAQAAACRGHDAWDVLDRITAPTLIIGGGQDHCLGGEASRLLADKIPGAVLCMYENLGHGLYEEAGDFNARVLDFVLQ